jgi:hypothetical protein
MSQTVAEHLVDTLAQAGVRRVYGIVGDSLNPVTDAIRRSAGVRWNPDLKNCGRIRDGAFGLLSLALPWRWPLPTRSWSPLS